MAQFECTFPSAYSFDDILQYFHAHLTKNHGEYTGGSDYASGRVRVAVRVYERYSVMGTGARTNFWRFFPTAQTCLRE